MLTYSSVDKVRAEKEITFACNCANTLDSNMRIIHKMRALNKKQRKYLKLWSQGFTDGLSANLSQDKKLVNPNLSTIEYENDTGNKQIKPDKECTEDVCQLCEGDNSAIKVCRVFITRNKCLSPIKAHT